jgi:hypothetical protein
VGDAGIEMELHEHAGGCKLRRERHVLVSE